MLNLQSLVSNAMRFCDITGHRDEIKKLSAMVDSGKIPHAILLYGQSGVGKTQVALSLIQYIYCRNRINGDSCGKCPACLQTAKLNNPDVHYIFPIVKKTSPPRTLSSDFSEEWKNFIHKHPFMPVEEWLLQIEAGNSRPMIHVTESEEILRQGSLSSYGDGYKIFLVWLPEKMNAEAANKLLKIIEEPFKDTLFILISNNPGEIIPTVRSRLQSIEFNPLKEGEIKSILIQKGIGEDEASALARISKGNVNTALNMADSGGEIGSFTSDFIGVMRACYARKMVDLKVFSEKFAGYGREKSLRLLQYFSRMIRESFISNLQCEPLQAMTNEEKEFVCRFGPFINAANVEEMASETDRAYEDISRNANQKIVWFDFMIELTRLIRTKGGIK